MTLSAGMSLDRIEDGQGLRTLSGRDLAPECEMGLKVMTVASKAEHVGLAKALIGRVLKLRQLEVRGVRPESLPAAVVDEQYGAAVPRHPPESLATATVPFHLRRMDAVGRDNEATWSSTPTEAARTPLLRVTERKPLGGSYGRLREGPVFATTAGG